MPRWYQRRFLVPGESRLRYLDLRPERIVKAPGKKFRSSLMHWGPDRCFARDHLYTLKLGRWMTDEIEHGFFKRIDEGGLVGVDFFANYELKNGFSEAWHGLMAFMDAQRFRTPRGLDWFAKATNVSNRNALLIAMRGIFQRNASMWTEAVWEVVGATNSPTKFLLTDNPVTFFNEKAFPGGRTCTYPDDAPLAWVGTRTIFPLSLEKCLIVTHLEHARNPWKNPESVRVNARSYSHAMFKAQDVQTQRELEDDEVKRINYILKKRADRYVAACNEEWLYPERSVSVSHWSNMDHDWFLMPNLFELHLGGTIFVGFKDGSSAGWDEHGRPREHPDFERRQKDEWEIFDRAQLEWGAKRLGKSIGIGDRTLHRGKRKPAWDGYMRERVEAYIAERRARRNRRSPKTLGRDGKPQ